MYWAQKIAKNIFPLSKENKKLDKALSEWIYTGEMNDLEEADETCQLCDHPNIRYQFLIRNIHTQNYLWIGSECITKFNIHATDESGNVLDKQETLDKVRKDKRNLITDAKEKRMIKSLIELATKDNEFNIENFIKYYKERNAFTPSQLSLLIWRLEKKGIKFEKSNFKMTIKRNREKEQLEEMEDWKIKKIWECMTSSQKRYCLENNLI
ncbi:hypothetical protein [Leptospira levettii]|uniref:hypothetical protein n=1 Tax=Leptospira levettii TaxID=2023178 RepID=UPI003EB86191